MTIQVQERVEGRRGCSYRKAGGIYLVGPPTGISCCKLPFPLTICPTCGAGIHVARGWTWVDVGKILSHGQGDIWECLHISYTQENQYICPLREPHKLGMAGLLWVGEKFYKTTGDFLQEAKAIGISRRISTVPCGFEPGKTWVLLAHRKGFTMPIKVSINGGQIEDRLELSPAIFSVFRPSAVEYVVHGDETQEELERLAGRGLVPVRVRNKVPYGQTK